MKLDTDIAIKIRTLTQTECNLNIYVTRAGEYRFLCLPDDTAVTQLIYLPPPLVGCSLQITVGRTFAGAYYATIYATALAPLNGETALGISLKNEGDTCRLVCQSLAAGWINDNLVTILV